MITVTLFKKSINIRQFPWEVLKTEPKGPDEC